MFVIYITAPYTGNTHLAVEANVLRSRIIGDAVAQAGMMPLIPQSNTAHMDSGQSPQFWYDGTMELMRRCDAVLLFGHSKGVVGEDLEARRLNLPVYELVFDPLSHHNASRDMMETIGKLKERLESGL